MENANGDLDQDSRSSPDWEGFIIPVFGAAIVILLILVLCQFYSKALKNFCCPRSIQNRITGDERPNETDQETGDVPPSYSVLSQNTRTFDVFQVEAGDDNSTHTQTVETITDKLPSYREILEAQKEQKEKTDTNLNDTNRNQAADENDNISLVTVVTENEEENLPPAYRPQTSYEIEHPRIDTNNRYKNIQ